MKKIADELEAFIGDLGAAIGTWVGEIVADAAAMQGAAAELAAGRATLANRGWSVVALSPDAANDPPREAH